MLTTTRIPTATPPTKSVVDVFEGLLGREITVTPGDPMIPRPATPAAVAIYTDSNLGMRAVVVLDVRLAASVGCALGLLPVETVATAVEEKSIPAAVVENLQEVLNVLASVFNVGAAPHLSLHQVLRPDDALPMDAAILARTLGRRLDLTMAIHGYESGQLSIVCA